MVVGVDGGRADGRDFPGLFHRMFGYPPPCKCIPNSKSVLRILQVNLFYYQCGLQSNSLFWQCVANRVDDGVDMTRVVI